MFAGVAGVIFFNLTQLNATQQQNRMDEVVPASQLQQPVGVGVLEEEEEVLAA